MNNKSIIRKKYKKIRDNIKNREIKNNRIFEILKNDNDYKNAKLIAIYNSFGSEVDTHKIIEYSLSIGKIVAIPRIVDDNMEFYKITRIDEDMELNKFGISEPKSTLENLVLKNNIDLMIVPGLCFDMNGNRLGYGKGFYDRYLENENIKTIGLCYEEQFLRNEFLPIDIYDKKIDKIIVR